jgi:hypothetical protein
MLTVGRRAELAGACGHEPCEPAREVTGVGGLADGVEGDDAPARAGDGVAVEAGGSGAECTQESGDQAGVGDGVDAGDGLGLAAGAAVGRGGGGQSARAHREDLKVDAATEVGGQRGHAAGGMRLVPRGDEGHDGDPTDR